jgi:ATP-dependent protease ClpP protease subunit
MKWYNINNSVKNALSISIDEEIGSEEITSKHFIEEIQASNPKEIDLIINSGGGSIFEALAMYDFLKTSNIKVNVSIVGVAASSASVLAYAGDELPTMTENSVIMVHNCSAPVVTAEMMTAEKIREFQNELESTAKLMDSINLKIAKVYAKATGLDLDVINEMMNNETWIWSDEAIEKGFVGAVNEGIKMAAFASTEALAKMGYKNTPKNYVNQLNTVNMSEGKDSVLDQIKALLGAKKEEAPVVENNIDVDALKAELSASIKAELSSELEASNVQVEELKALNAKQVIEAKASAVALDNSKKEIEKISASREGLPSKEDNPSGKSNEIKDELGEAILATFKRSGLIK